jgi:hypothetical protein
VLLESLELFIEFAFLADVGRFFFFELTDFGKQFFALLGHISDSLFRLLLLLLEINFVFLILVLILLECLHSVVKFFFFHHNILFQKFCLFTLVSYGNLCHEDFTRIQNEIPSGLLLLPRLVRVFNWLKSD